MSQKLIIISIIIFAVIAGVIGYFILTQKSEVDISISPTISSPNNYNILKIWEDGTAYAKGEVIEHISGCEVDGACKLILKVNDQKVALVYAEGDFECLNMRAVSWVNWGQNVNNGTKIKAYGAYREMDNAHELTFCDSKDYFILGENDPVPVGAYTEKFFDEVGKRKREVYKNQFEEAQKSGKWITYKNTELGYEFSYPATWSIPQTTSGTPFTIQYHDFSSQNNNFYTITLGFISQAQLNLMGITYCGAYPDDTSRCESMKIGGANSTIDWGIIVPITRIIKEGKEGKDTQIKASAWIPHPNGGIVTFELQPVTPESKESFYQILSTFRF